MERPRYENRLYTVCKIFLWLAVKGDKDGLLSTNEILKF